MKKSLVVLAAMMMVIAMVGSAFANGTSNVNAKAIVGNSCSVLATMTIPDIAVDLSLAGPFAQSTAGPVKCTIGHDFQINVSSADVTPAVPFTLTAVTGFKMKSGVNILNYSVSNGGDVTAAGLIAGAGFGTAKSVGITASVPVIGNETAPAGTYTDTIVLTIVY